VAWGEHPCELVVPASNDLAVVCGMGQAAPDCVAFRVAAALLPVTQPPHSRGASFSGD